MLLNIRLDLFLSEGADGRAKVATRPQRLPPLAFAHMGEFFLQLPRRTTFQILDQFRRTQQRWTGD